MGILDMERYAALARQAAAEGCVLLENRDHALPIEKGARVAVFGRSAFHYYKSGEGSGGLVNTRYVTGILDALKGCADLQVDQRLLTLYEEWIRDNPYQEGEGWGETPWSQEEMPVTPEMLEAAKRSDISLVIIGRTAGEDQDNANAPGSYLLTDQEEQLISEVCAASSRVAVILNVGNIIDMNWVEKYRPQAVLYVWQGGQEGGNGVLDVLTGAVNPCGRLTDTIAKDIRDYPAAANFGDPLSNRYQEDIYVGYRYFETFAKDRVLYPFGYGLSYTSFAITAELARIADQELELSVSVQNTGGCSGKEVVQIYAEAPQGVLGKPARQLIAFRKTGLIRPGSMETFSIRIPKYRMASYDDTGLTGNKSCYVLEDGDYRIYAGADVRSAPRVGSYHQDFVVIDRLRQVCAPQEEFQRMRPAGKDPDGAYRIGYETVPADGPTPDRHREPVAEIAYTGDRGHKLIDVLDGKIPMETFVAQLSDEDLICLIRGEGMCSPLVTPGTAGAFGGVTSRLRELGIPAICCADGPSGIRMDCGICAFSLPNGTLLGCTFNEELIEELFGLVGQELRLDRVDTLLGPGMNIHRHPLNGRNFEYVSEDPLLTGRIAAAQLRAMQRSGVTGTIKHFAGNNQEFGRSTVDSVVSERALREIYLKGFEIAVKEGQARSIMTTYGAINGIWTAGNYDLCTRILRQEWGYTGVVMTDWWAKSNYTGGVADTSIRAPMVAAQNDVYMCSRGSASDMEQDDVAQRLADRYLTRGELQRNAGNIFRFILSGPAILREAGRLADEPEPVYQLPIDGNAPSAAVCYGASGEGAIEVDGSILRPKRGRADSFDILTPGPGDYQITIRAGSAQGPLAQLPVTVYCDGKLKSMISIQGTAGAVTERQLALGSLDEGRHTVSLYYGAQGLEIRRLTIRQE